MGGFWEGLVLDVKVDWVLAVVLVGTGLVLGDVVPGSLGAGEEMGECVWG